MDIKKLNEEFKKILNEEDDNCGDPNNDSLSHPISDALKCLNKLMAREDLLDGSQQYALKLAIKVLEEYDSYTEKQLERHINDFMKEVERLTQKMGNKIEIINKKDIRYYRLKINDSYYCNLTFIKWPTYYDDTQKPKVCLETGGRFYRDIKNPLQLVNEIFNTNLTYSELK